MQFRAIASVFAYTASVSMSEPLQTSGQAAVTSPSPQYFVQVIPDGQDCNAVDNVLPMCASKNFVCRMEIGHEMDALAPSCLVYDPQNMQDDPFQVEETAARPWGNCDPMAELRRQIGDAPVCKRDFKCLCLQGAGQNCVCAPPDSVSDASGATTCKNGSGKCGEGEYCHYVQKGGMQCGEKPYYK